MIITESKPYGMIKAQLKKSDKIGIVACNTCARLCETGGNKKMKEYEKRLKKDGFNVVDTKLVGIACDFDMLKRSNSKGNTMLMLACDAGIQNLKKLFPKRKIVSSNSTIGLGTYDEKGNITFTRKFE